MPVVMNPLETYRDDFTFRNSPAAIARTARIGTGWLAGIQPPESVAPVVQAIRKASNEQGRPVPEDHYGATFAYRFGRDDDPIVSSFGPTTARLPGLSRRPTISPT